MTSFGSAIHHVGVSLHGQVSKDQHTNLRISYVAIFWAVAALVNATLSVLFPGLMTSATASGLYLVLCVLIMRSFPVAFLLFLPIAFLHFSALVSLNAIEAGAYMREMGRFGYPSAASSIYLLVVSVILCSATLVFYLLSKKEFKHANIPGGDRNLFIRRWAAFVFACFVIAFLLVKGTLTAFPLLQGIDRFEYRRYAGDPITLNFLNMKILIASFLGASAAQCPAWVDKLRHHLVFLAYICTSFLFGDKFFIIICASLFYVACQAVFNPERVKPRLKRMLPFVLIGVAAASAVTTYIYSNNGALSMAQTAIRLSDRMASQGQLWFLAFEDSPAWIRFDKKEVQLNIESLYRTPSQDFAFEHKLAGLHFVQKYAPRSMYLSFLRNAGYVTPVMVFEAYALDMFGFVGLFLCAAMVGVLLGCIAYQLLAATRSGNPFNALLPAFFFLQFYYLIASGTLYNLIGLGSIKAYVAFAVLQFLISTWIRWSPVSHGISNRLRTS